MATPTADKLRTYFASKYLVADGGALTQYTCDSGCTVTTIRDAALTQANDYWNGAIGWFDGATATAALRGIFFHVEDFIAATDDLVLSKDLPATPANTDTYHLVLGGNYRAATELFGLTADGDLPELISVTGTNITGITLKRCAPALGAGTLTLFYDQSEDELFAKMDAQAYGVALDVSGDLSDAILFIADGEAYVQVDVVNASLPVGDETDTFTTAQPTETMTPDYEGYETDPDQLGMTRYRLEVCKNTDGADQMVGLDVYLDKPAGAATTIAGGESIGTSEGDFEVTSAAGWPTQGFWAKNTTVNGGAGDCRYVKYRSADRLYCQGVVWATLAFDTGSVEISQDDVISDNTSGATASVDQVTVTGGTWGGGDAAGTLILRDVDGSFGVGNDLYVSGGKVAEAAGNSILSLRGFIAVSWTAADDVEPMSDVDIGLDAPAADQFEDPDTERTQPAGVTFSDASDAGSALAIGNLAVSALYGVWRREWIVDDARPRSDVDADSHYSWS